MISLKGKKVALVMSGGGAKGAYQLGMLRALEEAGLEKENLILAGTSRRGSGRCSGSAGD